MASLWQRLKEPLSSMRRQTDVDCPMLRTLLKEALDCRNSDSCFALHRGPLKNDEVSLGHRTAEIESHVSREKLFAYQLPF